MFQRIALLTLSAAVISAVVSTGECRAQSLTLDSAIETALTRSSRGAIIREKRDIAASNYRAKRINFYVPLLTINGALPSYSVDQSYRLFGAAVRKRLYKTSDFGLNSFIGLQQSLITGGNLTMTANLTSSQSRYPDTDPFALPGSLLEERGRQGFFDFKLVQPILKPSESKNDLDNRRSDLDLAELARVEEETGLRKEVMEAYIGLLESALTDSLEAVRLEGADLKADTDSTKWEDGVITAEARLASASARLDAELARRDAADKLAESERGLALLLDYPADSRLRVENPVVTGNPSAEALAQVVEGWDRSIAVRKAMVSAKTAKRTASFARAGHGLTGDLTAGYSAGRGKISYDNLPDNNINTNGWGVSLNLTYPIWDGGAASASSQAARSEANRAEMELVKAKQAAQAEITRLAKQVDVGYRRLSILRSQIDLATQKRAIARERFDDGRISRYELLQSEADWLAARGKYLAELKVYMGNRILLEGAFPELD
jgi:outer membrane protein TolC